MIMKLSVAMATYNGERHLKEQLESLLLQTRLPDELVICDDGSIDTTCEQIASFSESSPFPIRLYRNDSQLGFAENFLKAASLCQGDWIAFCDQDDVWHTEKLAVIEKDIYLNTNAVLVIHDADMVDENLRSLRRRMPNIKHNRVRKALTNRIWWTPPGFVCCFRASLLSLADVSKRPGNYHHRQNSMPHDYYVYFVANMAGDIIYNSRLLAKYRRHIGAVSGNYENSLSHTMNNIGRTGSEDYFDKAGLLKDYQQFATKMGKKCAAYFFLDMSQRYQLRGKLYQEDSILKKQRLLFQLLTIGGYKSRYKGGMGVLSFLKDMLFSLRYGNR